MRDIDDIKIETGFGSDKLARAHNFDSEMETLDTVEWSATAQYSPDCQHRYTLTRLWDGGKPMCAFIGFNPSTATAEQNDPTIRRCMAYAYRWGYGGLLMLNVCSYRATDPRSLPPTLKERVGHYNCPNCLRNYLRNYNVGMVVAAWGSIDGAHASAVKNELSRRHVRLHALAINATDGAAGHPLYRRANLTPVPYNFVRGCCPHPQCGRPLLNPDLCAACEHPIVGSEAV